MKAWYLLGAALFLTACGGGSSDRAAPEASTSPAPKFFGADNGANGQQLWKTDGTSAGTSMVKVINASGDAEVQVITRLGDKTLFMATDGIHGKELWITDGTEAGTTLLKDIHVGFDGNFIPSFAVLDNTIYFSAYDNVNKQELWKSDGTTAGTVLVKDINPGPNSSSPIHLVALGSSVFFAANDGTSGYELWTSDGTEAGTVMVKDISPGLAGSILSGMISADGALYFAASNGVDGVELWKSDGTEAGTGMVKDINPGAGHSLPDKLVAMAGNVYFVAAESVAQGNELWRTDGTEAGTYLVKDINTNVAGSVGASGADIRLLSTAGDKLYFRARTVFPGPFGLWVSDGSEAGTVPLFTADSVNYLMVTSDNVFFTGSDVAHGDELWTTDGTVAGTVFVKDINTGPDSSDFYSLGEDYLHESKPAPVIEIEPGVALLGALRADIGEELWRSDGTAAGTTLIKDINPDMGSGL